MHWIENLFGMEPDGGNGMLEAAIFAVTLAIAVVALACMRTHHLSIAILSRWAGLDPEA